MNEQEYIKQTTQEIYKVLEKEVKTEIGQIFDQFAPDFMEYAALIAKLQFKLMFTSNANIEFALENAKVGVALLKARLQNRIESGSMKIVEKLVGVLLDAAVIFGRAYLASVAEGNFRA